MLFLACFIFKIKRSADFENKSCAFRKQPPNFPQLLRKKLGEPLRFARVGLFAPSPSRSRHAHCRTMVRLGALRRFALGGSATIPLAARPVGARVIYFI
jgi:hypothetical protein